MSGHIPIGSCTHEDSVFDSTFFNDYPIPKWVDLVLPELDNPVSCSFRSGYVCFYISFVMSNRIIVFACNIRLGYIPDICYLVIIYIIMVVNSWIPDIIYWKHTCLVEFPLSNCVLCIWSVRISIVNWKYYVYLNRWLAM
jgi:hypothetical protein